MDSSRVTVAVRRKSTKRRQSEPIVTSSKARGHRGRTTSEQRHTVTQILKTTGRASKKLLNSIYPTRSFLWSLLTLPVILFVILNWEPRTQAKASDLLPSWYAEHFGDRGEDYNKAIDQATLYEQGHAICNWPLLSPPLHLANQCPSAYLSDVLKAQTLVGASFSHATVARNLGRAINASQRSVEYLAIGVSNSQWTLPVGEDAVKFFTTLWYRREFDTKQVVALRLIDFSQEMNLLSSDLRSFSDQANNFFNTVVLENEQGLRSVNALELRCNKNRTTGDTIKTLFSRSLPYPQSLCLGLGEAKIQQAFFSRGANYLLKTEPLIQTAETILERLAQLKVYHSAIDLSLHLQNPLLNVTSPLGPLPLMLDAITPSPSSSAGHPYRRNKKLLTSIDRDLLPQIETLATQSLDNLREMRPRWGRQGGATKWERKRRTGFEYPAELFAGALRESTDWLRKVEREDGRGRVRGGFRKVVFHPDGTVDVV